MRKLRAASTIILPLSILIIGCGKTPRPDLTFHIELTPENITADVGDTLTLTGSINSVENLFAISFDLVFDSTVVNFQSLSLPQDNILGENSISFSNEIEGGVSISLGRTQSAGNDNISASGVLFAADFIAAGVGTTEIQYQNVYIIDENGDENADLGAVSLRGAEIIVR